MANYPYVPYQPTTTTGGFLPPMYTAVQWGAQPMQAPTQSVQPQTGIASPAPTQQGLVCCSVTSRAEAEAQRVEAFGPGVLMADFGHGMVYFKRFNNDTALADFVEFKIVPPASEESQEQQMPGGLDFMAIVGAITSRFDAMEEKMDSIAEQLKTKPVPPKSTTSRGGTKK